MIKDLDRELTDLEGNPIKEGLETITVRKVVVNALLSQAPEENTKGDDKAKRYELAFRIRLGGSHDFKSDELTLIKERVGVIYLPIIVGQIYRWADRDPAAETSE